MLHRFKTSASRTTRRLVESEEGGEVIEYALILGLVIVLAIVTITSVGTKVLARWQTVNSSM